MRIERKLAAALCTTLVAFGCADAEKTATPLAPADRPAAAAQGVATEKAALDELTRAVALALRDEGLRHRLRNDLRESRSTVEHKLHLSSYLRGQSGGILLAKMAKETGTSRDELLALLERVRPLEFYMPVRAHRASWRGGSGLQVASYLEDDGSERPAVFDVNGHVVPLWAPEDSPVVPTLALVPVETDFTRSVGSGAVNRDDNGGETIGTYMIEEPCMEMMSASDVSASCTGGGGDGGGYTPPPTPTYTPGLWMTYAYGNENVPDGTWGLKGEPEIEIHVFGASAADPSKAASLSCSHANAYGSYRFDMNDHSWSGNVLIFSKQQIDNYYARTTDDFAVQMWEDDDTDCVIKTDKDLAGLMKGIYDGWRSNAVKKNPDGTTSIDWGKILKVIWDNASWLKSNDDFVGNARKPAVGEAWTYTDATHKLQRSTYDNNGRLRLIFRQ